MRKFFSKFVDIEIYKDFSMEHTYVDVLFFGSRIAKFKMTFQVISGRSKIERV